MKKPSLLMEQCLCMAHLQAPQANRCRALHSSAWQLLQSCQVPATKSNRCPVQFMTGEKHTLSDDENAAPTTRLICTFRQGQMPQKVAVQRADACNTKPASSLPTSRAAVSRKPLHS